jgi:heat shock protein HslJ
MTRSSRRATVLLALPLLLAVTACGDDSEPVTTDPAPTTPAGGDGLDGRTFLSTATTGIELVEGSVLRISFDDGSLSASGGCNNMFGGYTIVDGTLEVGAMGSTEMACEQPLMDQDTAVIAFLTSGPAVALSGDDLVLGDTSATSITLLDRVVADPDRPLEGTVWVVESIISNESVSSVPIGAEASITFTQGTAAVEAGCNTGSAPAEVADGVITFGPLALTKMMCPDDVMTLENAVVATLSGPVTFEIEADSLTLTASSGDGLGLRAEQ